MAIIDSLLDKGILLSPELIEDKESLDLLESADPSIFEGVDVIDHDFIKKNIIERKREEHKDYEIIFSYEKKPKKISLNDFVSYFNRRFEGLSKYLRQRVEFQGATSIARIKSKNDRDRVALIGLVYEKNFTKKNNLILTLEDPTGTINVIVSQDREEVYAAAKEAMLDEVIGIEGSISNKDGSSPAIFANQFFVPDVPSVKELKKGPVEEYAIFLGDLHFGSNVFLKKPFEDFLAWISGEKGSAEQKRIASKVKYILCTGDLVEGVGVYPGQEEDLEINDIKEQYDLFAEYLKKIPNHIRIFIIPGNHDAGRLSEPQQPIRHEYAKSLQTIPNVVLLSNPSIVRIGIREDFPGFDVLIYHGYSMIYYANNIESIRNAGGQKRPDLIMKYLLQRRHLAPSHTSNLYIPDTDEDPMILKHIPDFFVTGHIHRVSVGQYKNITLLNCSCWTDVTEDQEKRGLEPQPGKLPIVNLKTREVKIINLLKEPKKKEGEDADDKENELNEGKSE
ncbi:metallophosphoesterase [Candidatus Woesearchaeota archaeon]|nr:metallophosphoesterase [Candidatus Woesearchaeota archaeon]